MIYSESTITHSMNVIYKAEEYTTRFGLLVTAMSDPYDKTILAGMSIRYSPTPGYIRVDMGTFDYGKYVVQTNSWVDIPFPKIPGDMYETIGNAEMKYKPGFSFRFLPEEENKDRSIVTQINLSLELLDYTNKYVSYDLRSKDAAFKMRSDTPSVKIHYFKNKISIMNYASVDTSNIDEYINMSYIISGCQNSITDVDDPQYQEGAEMEILLKDELDYLHLNIDDLGNVEFLRFTTPDWQFTLDQNDFIRYYYRRGLVNGQTGLTIAKQFGVFVYGYQTIENMTDKTASIPPSTDGDTTTVNEFTNILFNSNVITTKTSHEYGYIQRYHWIELFPGDEFPINKLIDISVDYHQLYSADFDESYFGMSFSPDDGLSWFYCNTINDILVARFVSFDPVIATPISPEVIHDILTRGIINKKSSTDDDSYFKVIDDDFGNPTYEDYFTDSDDDKYIHVLHDISALDNTSYSQEIVNNPYINKLLIKSIFVSQSIPFKVAITFKYFHDSNIIKYYAKDVTDIDHLDCIIGLLVTQDSGTSFGVDYRDPVYQRMIPYAEWCDTDPVENSMNMAYLANTQAANSKPGASTLGQGLEGDKDTIDSAIGNTNTTYSFTTLGDMFTESAALTSIKLYTDAFIQSSMLLYDFDYVKSMNTDVYYIKDGVMTTTGFIYKNICYLDKNQYVEYLVELPSDVSRLMLLPVFNRDVVDTDYLLLVNGEKYASFLELSGDNRDFSKAKIRFVATRRKISIFGIGILYDVREQGPDPLRINNGHNRNVPYFDYTKIDYNQNISKTELLNSPRFPINVSWDIHLDDPDDNTYVEIYMYDVMIYRSPNLSENNKELIINTSAVRTDDLYIENLGLVIPIVFKAINKFGERTVEHALTVSLDNVYDVQINDFKYVLTKTIVDDKNNDDPDDDVTYYDYLVLISIDVNHLDNIYYEFWNDKNDASKGVIKSKATPQIISVNLLLREDQLPRETKLKAYSDDGFYLEERTLTIDK